MNQPQKKTLKISKDGIILNGRLINNIEKIVPPKPEKKEHPNKKNNNKIYLDFVKEARKWDKYKGMGYQDFLKNSKSDFKQWKVYILERSDDDSSCSEDDFEGINEFDMRFMR